MFTPPFSPTRRQLETVWRDVLADPLTVTRYNLGLPTLEEMLDRRLHDGTVCLTVSNHWSIVNWAHDFEWLADVLVTWAHDFEWLANVPEKAAAWSGGWVSPAGRGPSNAHVRRLVHAAVVERFYRSIGVVIHGAAVVVGNLAGERHTKNIGYFPVCVAPDFARVRRTPVRGEEEGVLTAHTIWCWGEDNARVVHGLAMQRTQGPQGIFEERELIHDIQLG